MEFHENMQEEQEERLSAWDRLKEKRVNFSDTGKATLATAIGAPGIFELGMHLPGNLGLGLSAGAIIFSIAHGDKAFRAGRWLRERFLADNGLAQPQEESGEETPSLRERFLRDNGLQPSEERRQLPNGRASREELSQLREKAQRGPMGPSTEDCLQLSHDLVVHADDFLAERKIVVGISGSGKSNTVADISEELGRLGVPFVLFDTENEYKSLCNERYIPRYLRLDSSNLSADSAAEQAAYILDHRMQAIVNLQDFSDEQAALIMINMIEGLTKWQEERPNNERIPCEVILEEATTWLPQRTSESVLSTETLNLLQAAFFNDVVRKGRKRGLGFTAVCQKIAEIDKRALQCKVKFLHAQSELNDLKRYAEMGIDHKDAMSLKQGEAFVWVGRIAKKRIHMRLRTSPHGASTPKLANLRVRDTTEPLSIILPASEAYASAV